MRSQGELFPELFRGSMYLDSGAVKECFPPHLYQQEVLKVAALGDLCGWWCLLKLMDRNWCALLTKVHTPSRVPWLYKSCLYPSSLSGHNTFNCLVSLFSFKLWQYPRFSSFQWRFLGLLFKHSVNSISAGSDWCFDLMGLQDSRRKTAETVF